MSKDELKRRVCEEIDRHAGRIIEIGQTIFHDPELGFKEFKPAKVVNEVFDFLELKYESGLAITGVKSMVEGGRSGPTVAVMGELDSVLVADHEAVDAANREDVGEEKPTDEAQAESGDAEQAES
jgi:metal-dependent amidase/aminoacylase/carboxypeptidase family protein